MKHFVICSVLYKKNCNFLRFLPFNGVGMSLIFTLLLFCWHGEKLGASDGHCMHWAFIGDNKVYLCVNFCHLLSNIDHSCQQFTSHSKLQWCHVALLLAISTITKHLNEGKNTVQYCHWDILIRFRIGYLELPSCICPGRLAIIAVCIQRDQSIVNSQWSNSPPHPPA